MLLHIREINNLITKLLRELLRDINDDAMATFNNYNKGEFTVKF